MLFVTHAKRENEMVSNDGCNQTPSLVYCNWKQVGAKGRTNMGKIVVFCEEVGHLMPVIKHSSYNSRASVVSLNQQLLHLATHPIAQAHQSHAHHHHTKRVKDKFGCIAYMCHHSRHLPVLGLLYSCSKQSICIFACPS